MTLEVMPFTSNNMSTLENDWPLPTAPGRADTEATRGDIAALGLRKEYDSLLRRLRAHVGDSLLEDVRFVAHPVTTNAFISGYRHNFIK